MIKEINNIKYLSTSEVAKILKISRVAVFQKIKAGLILAEKIGRNYAVKADDITKALQGTLTDNRKKEIDEAVKKVVLEYGKTLRLLGRE
jgi:excisionase family DNA binding protein